MLFSSEEKIKIIENIDEQDLQKVRELVRLLISEEYLRVDRAKTAEEFYTIQAKIRGYKNLVDLMNFRQEKAKNK